MKDNYVTLEQTKLLEELGFSLEYKKEIRTLKGSSSIYDLPYLIINYNKPICPTRSIVLKWLRSKRIDILPMPTQSDTYTLFVYLNKEQYWYSNESYKEYEDAVSAGIDKALNIIKDGEVKSKRYNI